MCGIAGWVSFAAESPPGTTLRRMTDIIRHRGPDGEGCHIETSAALGHRRLSIIDLATGGQPMANEDGDIWITYNGEIFNHAEIRPGLERAGHRYATRSDTETIIHAYEEYGTACVSRLRGMFAFALWDRRKRSLFCARDRLGKKPFYYFWDGRTFVFASEIKALLQHPAISPELEESLLAEYLAFGYISGPKTLFAGISKLMPGHWLLLSESGLKLERYWDVPVPGHQPKRDDRSWIEECRNRIEISVRTRLMSDVPLGMFLSGGLDSSTIAALMARMISGRVKTFAVGYPESEFSELSYARQVADAIGAEHHEIVVGKRDFFNALPRLIWHEDEPVTWPSSVSLYFVSKLAFEHVKVVLTGEGSDELFAGYARYRLHLLNRRLMDCYSLLPQAARRSISSAIADSPLLPAGWRRMLQHSFLGRNGTLESLYLDNFYSAFSRSEQQSLLNPSVVANAPYDSFLAPFDSRPEGSLLSRMLYADQKTYLVELLMKQDQMSMAASIESRVPLLDHPLVEFAATVPDHLKIRHGGGKYILKRAAEGLLPRQIIYRKKMGFPTPLRRWLLDPACAPLYSRLQARGGILAEYFHRPALDALLERHRSGRQDATDKIWRLLNLQLWGDIFLTGRCDALETGLLEEDPQLTA